MLIQSLPSDVKIDDPIFPAEVVARFRAKIAQTADNNACWLWTASHGGSGYPHFWVKLDGKRVCRDAHRITYAIAHNRWPTMPVLHRCNVKFCNNPSHLFEGSHKQNTQQALRDGLINRKLGPWHVRRIVSARKKGAMVVELAGKFGVRQDQIKRILRGESWSPVTNIKPRAVIKPAGVQLSMEYA